MGSSKHCSLYGSCFQKHAPSGGHLFSLVWFSLSGTRYFPHDGSLGTGDTQGLGFVFSRRKRGIGLGRLKEGKKARKRRNVAQSYGLSPAILFPCGVRTASLSSQGWVYTDIPCGPPRPETSRPPPLKSAEQPGNKPSPWRHLLPAWLSARAPWAGMELLFVWHYCPCSFTGSPGPLLALLRDTRTPLVLKPGEIIGVCFPMTLRFDSRAHSLADEGAWGLVSFRD